MHKKIEALAEEAGFSVDYFDYVSDKNGNTGINLDEFAQLIIKECAKVAAGAAEKEGADDFWHVGNAVKKHFGVK
jgi:hypothetical protein